MNSPIDPAIVMPDGASLDRTRAVADRVEGIFGKIPGVDTRTQLTGYSLLDSGFKTNAGTFFVTLKPFEERYESVKRALAENARAVLMALHREAAAIGEGLVLPVAPPAIPGIGTTGGFEFWIQDTAAGEPARLDALTREFLAKARTRPELTGLSSTFRATTQQLRIDVDREKASLLGVPAAWVGLGVAFGQAQDAAGAERAFRQAIALDPDCVEGWYNLGYLQLQLGREADARQSLEQVLRCEPAHADARALLERLR